MQPWLEMPCPVPQPYSSTTQPLCSDSSGTAASFGRGSFPSQLRGGTHLRDCFCGTRGRIHFWSPLGLHDFCHPPAAFLPCSEQELDWITSTFTWSCPKNPSLPRALQRAHSLCYRHTHWESTSKSCSLLSSMWKHSHQHML